MKVAFHFDADHERFDRYDGIPVIKEIFQILIQETTDYYLKIFTGNIDALDYLKQKHNREKIQKGIFLAPRPVWQSLNPNFVEYLFNNKIFVVAFEGIGSRLRDTLHKALLNDDTYLGAQQIHEANPVHWVLYGASVIPMFRINGRKLSLLYAIGQEFEWDRAVVANLKDAFSFESIDFEEVSVTHTILDDYSSFEHASRVSNLSSMLYDHLNLLADRLMLRLTQFAPDLYQLMNDTFIEFETLDNPQGLYKASIAGSKILEKLSDRITAEPAEQISEGSHFEQLVCYIKQNAKEDCSDYLIAQLKEINNRIKTFSSPDVFNSDIDTVYEGGRLLTCLVIFVGDVIAMGDS